MSSKLNNNLFYLLITNRLYIDYLYKQFVINTNIIDYSWKKFFNNLSFYNIDNKIDSNNLDFHKVFNLINAFRCYGHEDANLNPIKLFKKKKNYLLDLNYYCFKNFYFKNNYNLKKLSIFFYYINFVDLFNLYNFLKKTYCSSIGVEFMYIKNINERNWISDYFESSQGVMKFNSINKKNFLDELICANYIENYISSNFPGAKRFSLEGAEVLIPMLKEVIRYSSNNKIKKIIFGMAHRGRLNILVNILGKNFFDILNEFKNEYRNYYNSGDVKYHQGYSSCVKINKKLIKLILNFNPSHLEIINPVIMGVTKSYIDKLDNINEYKILPITLHGDAAICGQGVVQETLNMSKVPCYDVGGTLRIIINNQIGFTTSDKNSLRSGYYCTDIAKMIDVPVFHVNADDVEAACFVIHAALDYRNVFNKDVFIDLVCYRRYGHNESDDPSVTQPLMYNKIKKHSNILNIYDNFLIKTNVILNDYKKNKEKIINFSFFNRYYTYYDLFKEKNNIILNVNKKILKKLAKLISFVPEEFNIHSRVKKIYSNRKLMSDEIIKIDWGFAETLAYSVLLFNGVSIRLSGEDTQRGTFFHRHAVIYDQVNEKSYIPLNNVNLNNKFKVWNSVLSEESALAFEYGYSINSNTLVIWEAQFGDFVNGAQVILDQFIVSGEQKWNQVSNIVLFLPHGYEGQGPEHSSARLERYLQLCAENNIQICIPTTSAQIYHLLLMQVCKKKKKPLIVFSPKSLLRNNMTTSFFNDLLNNKFNFILDEFLKIKLFKINKLIFCCGKIYYDLLEERKKKKYNNVFIIRIEKLYPFPLSFLQNIILKYFYVKNLIWCQEEPKNQGSWYWIKNYILSLISINSKLTYIGRNYFSSTSTGYLFLHKIQQKKIIFDSFN